MNWRVRSLDMSTWPGQRTKAPRPSPFKSKWSATTDVLDREMFQLEARDVVLEMDISERNIRNDGCLRADASPRSAGVVLSFQSKHGPLRYPCDTFTNWQDNVRAIALALEALRKVDRYGVTPKGEQYAGFARLPAPGNNGDASGFSSIEEAARFVACGITSNWQSVLEDEGTFRRCYRMRARDLHPDRGGDAEQFKRLQKAKALIEADVVSNLKTEN